MSVPGDAPQLLIFVLFVIPGAVYQAVRSRLRGPTPEDQDIATRLLLAVAFSAGLNGLYIVALGGKVAEVVSSIASLPVGGDAMSRSDGVLLLVALFLAPALVAFLDHQRLSRGLTLRTTYDPIPKP